MKLGRLALLGLTLLACGAGAAPSQYFIVEVIDESSGRGVPLVELRTTSSQRFWTDSAGIVALDEPGWKDRDVFFEVSSPGYEFAKDGFGFRGQAVHVEPGKSATLKIKRNQIAERLYRLTGEGIYRDSQLAGRVVPIKQPLLNAGVMGSDSAQTAVYNGKLFWIWGDTSRPDYPLGNYNATGAVSALPAAGGIDPLKGVDYDYFVDEKGLSRGMAPVPGEGPTWLTGMISVPEAGKERLFAAYVKIKNHLEVYERGLVRWDDAKQVFEPVKKFPLEAPIGPGGHAWRWKEAQTEYVYFGDPFPWVRAPATGEGLADLSRYEAYTCLKDGSTVEAPILDRDEKGLHYAWRKNAPAINPEDLEGLIRQKKLARSEALVRFEDPELHRPVVIHRGTVRWNAYRKRWIMIANEIGGAASNLGEVWYSEAENPIGPWVGVRKIATHPHYSFYNPLQHPEFDQEGGRIIYFEGTYTNSFSGNPEATPRYDYNQLMYRLDLSDPRLKP